MKKGGGKAKGSAFERKIARAIDSWWEVASGTFWRSVNSGGWKEPGDIAPRNAVEFPFVIECKFYKSVNPLDIFKPNMGSSHLRTWMVQLNREIEHARATKKQPSLRPTDGLLIFKYNGSPTFVAFSLKTNSFAYSHDSEIKSPFITVVFDDSYIGIALLDEFTKAFPKSYILSKFYASSPH